MTILEGAVTGEPSAQKRRLQRFDTTTRKWLPGTLIYELDADTMSVTDISSIEGNRFVVIERDDQTGDGAKAKRVYAIDLDKAVPANRSRRSWSSTCWPSAMRAGWPKSLPAGTPFRFPFLTLESIQVLDRKHVVLVNDNNYPATGGRGVAVADATEWIWLELANPL